MVNQQKQELVKKLAAEIKIFPLVAIVNLENLPAPQLQNMKRALRKKDVYMIVIRKRLLLRALEASGKEKIKELAVKIRGMPALLLAKDNPFALYSFIQKNKSEAPAKPGQIAPRDLIVKAGPTNFAPGPIISELAAVGIKTKVEGGKLTVIQDTVIVRAGVVISQKVAETLKRLDIRPMELGLNLVAVWEKGLVFDAKQLYIDEAEYASNLTQATRWAMNLAIEAAYACADTAEILVQKAFRNAQAAGIEAAIMTAETRDAILAKSEAQASAIRAGANL